MSNPKLNFLTMKGNSEEKNPWVSVKGFVLREHGDFQQKYPGKGDVKKMCHAKFRKEFQIDYLSKIQAKSCKAHSKNYCWMVVSASTSKHTNVDVEAIPFSGSNSV